VAGGHTTKDVELRCGLAVTGIVHPGRVVTNAGARAGDQLVLTKPLGIGLITTALRVNAAAPEAVAAANACMVRLNRSAAAAMTAVGVDSATDITGFGLLGHAWEMAQASHVDLFIDSRAVPLLPGVGELAAQGLFPGGSERNREYMTTRTDFGSDVPETTRMLLCDAQTSGGLLIAVAPDRCEELIQRLLSVGERNARAVGRAEGGSGRVRVC
jgi:selenide,water dikinase